MCDCIDAHRAKHHHRGKSSEDRFDKHVILENLSITPGLTILDAGCGNGYMAKEFARLTGETGKVYALDQDDVSIDALTSETKNTVIEPQVGDITTETDLSPSSIDLIYVSMVLHGFTQTQMEGFLREVNRILKPDGKLAIVEIDKVETPFGPPLEIRISPEELRQTVPLHPLHLIDIGQFSYMQVFKK